MTGILSGWLRRILCRLNMLLNAIKVEWSAPGDQPSSTNIYDYLRQNVTTGSGGRGGRGAGTGSGWRGRQRTRRGSRRRSHPQTNLHGGLHCAHAFGTQGRRGGLETGQAVRLDRITTPLWCAVGVGASPRHTGGAHPRDRAGHRFGVWRQAHRRSSRRSGAAFKGGRHTGQNGLDSPGGIYLGLLSSRWRH